MFGPLVHISKWAALGLERPALHQPAALHMSRAQLMAVIAPVLPVAMAAACQSNSAPATEALAWTEA